MIRALREDATTTQIPFIPSPPAATADVRTGMNYGADDYLSQAGGRDDLLAAIETRLARAAAVQAANHHGGNFKPDFSSAAPFGVRAGPHAPRSRGVALDRQGKEQRRHRHHPRHVGRP